MTINKIKISIILIFSSLVGILIDFFAWTTGSFSNISNAFRPDNKTLFTASTDGTISSGGVCLFLAFIILIGGLVIGSLIAIKLIKNQGDIPVFIFIIAMALGLLNLIAAFVYLSVFIAVGNSYMRVSLNSHYLIASSPSDFWYIYFGAFEASITAISGGVIGMMEMGKNPRTNHSKSKYNIATIKQEFKVGDEIVYHGKTNLFYFEGAVHPEETFRILEIGLYGTNKVIRLSDEMIFSNIRLSNYSLHRACPDELEENKPIDVMTDAPNEGELNKNAISDNVQSDEPDVSLTDENKQSENMPSDEPDVSLTGKNKQNECESDIISPNESTPKNVKTEKERIELIKEYKALLDCGIITQEEFDKKKKELLDI